MMNESHKTFVWIAAILASAAVLLVAGCETIPPESSPRSSEFPAPPPASPGDGQTTIVSAMPGTAAEIASSPVLGGVHVEPAEETIVQIDSDSDFYEPLEPYGTWVTVYPYGRCWYPRSVAPGWRPYCHGNWVWCDSGWYWRTSEPWGWATYHYGRWTYATGYGWVWIPLTTWAPSWVCWRQCGDYVGWAPLPPCDVDYFGGYYYWPSSYVYIPASHFTEPVTPQNTVVASTPPSTQPVVVVNEPPPKSRIEQLKERAISRAETYLLRVESEGTIAQKHPLLAARLSEIVQTHRPVVVPPAARRDIAIASLPSTDASRPLREAARQFTVRAAPVVSEPAAQVAAPGPMEAQASSNARRVVYESRSVTPQHTSIPIRETQRPPPASITRPETKPAFEAPRPAPVANYRAVETRPSSSLANMARAEPPARPIQMETRRETYSAPARTPVIQNRVEPQVRTQNAISAPPQQQKGNVRQSIAEWRDGVRRERSK